jgi:tripartite-type tricarboxylate transporter receptor subunit TctC
MRRNDIFCRTGRTLLALALAATGATMASATPVVAQPSLQGKTVTIYAGGGVGAGVDSYSRLLAPYLSQHLPGRPSVVVSNMPGAGGMQALQYVYNVAAKDGTAIATTNVNPIYEALLGTTNVGYNLKNFGWIGSLAQGDTVCAIWHEAGVNTIEYLRRKEVTVGATGARSAATAVTLLLNSVLGTRLKAVAGYKGGGEVLLAMERREVDGNCVTLNSLRTTRPDWLRDKKVRIVLQIAMVADPEYPDAPLAIDLVTSPAARQMLELYLAPYEVQNPFMLPPGTNKATIDVFRRAFQATMNDEAYRSDAAKRNQAIVPKSGEMVETILAKMMSAPAGLLSNLKAITSATP